MKLELQEPYAPRPTTFIELWQHGGWKMKVYGISYRRERPRPQLVEAAKRIARERLPSVTGDETYGVGFLGIHDGRGGNWIFVDWWADENVLHHHLYQSSDQEPERFEYVTPSGLMACVFELRVIVGEQQAWIDTVLANPAGPGIEAYLERRAV